jgi:hypothetical protein
MLAGCLNIYLMPWVLDDRNSFTHMAENRWHVDSPLLMLIASNFP